MLAWPAVNVAPVIALTSWAVTSWHGSTDVGTAVAWAACDSAAPAEAEASADAGGVAGATDAGDGEGLAPVEHAARPRIDAAMSARSPGVVFRLVLVIVEIPQAGRWSCVTR